MASKQNGENRLTPETDSESPIRTVVQESSRLVPLREVAEFPQSEGASSGWIGQPVK